MAKQTEKKPPALKGVSAAERALAVLTAFRRGDSAFELGRTASSLETARTIIRRQKIRSSGGPCFGIRGMQHRRELSEMRRHLAACNGGFHQFNDRAEYWSRPGNAPIGRKCTSSFAHLEVAHVFSALRAHHQPTFRVEIAHVRGIDCLLSDYMSSFRQREIL
jgi:hypothetical protein